MSHKPNPTLLITFYFCHIQKYFIDEINNYINVDFFCHIQKTMVSHDGMSEIIWTPGRAYWRCYEQDKGHFRYVAELSPEFPEWVNRSGRVVDRTKAVNYSKFHFHSLTYRLYFLTDILPRRVIKRTV